MHLHPCVVHGSGSRWGQSRSVVPLVGLFSTVFVRDPCVKSWSQSRSEGRTGVSRRDENMGTGPLDSDCFPMSSRPGTGVPYLVTEVPQTHIVFSGEG